MMERQKVLAIKRMKSAAIIAEYFGAAEACAVGTIKLIDAVETNDEVLKVNDINEAACAVIKTVAYALNQRANGEDKSIFEFENSEEDTSHHLIYNRYCVILQSLIDSAGEGMPDIDKIGRVIKDAMC